MVAVSLCTEIDGSGAELKACLFASLSAIGARTPEESRGRISDRLKSRFGPENVFFDVEDIEAGRRWRDELAKRVGACDALVAVIGKGWNPVGANDLHRLNDPKDYVRIEVQAALERGVPVVPVLIDGANIPKMEDLPGDLRRLADWQWIEISESRFDYDVGRLTTALSSVAGRVKQEDGKKLEFGNAPKAVEPAPARRTEMTLAFAFGCIAIGLVLWLAFRGQTVDEQHFEIIRIVLALAGGGVGAAIPGLLDINIKAEAKLALRAGAALVLSVILYFSSSRPSQPSQEGSVIQRTDGTSSPAQNGSNNSVIINGKP
jgi:hypothetical protein